MDQPDDLSAPRDPGRAWAAPESAQEPRPSPPSAAGVDLAPSTTASAGRPVPVPVPLRPMTMGDLLDGGFAILRLQPRTVLTLAAVFVVPVQLAVAYLQRDVLRDLDVLIDQTFANQGAQTGQAAGSGWATLISLVGGSMTTGFIAAGLATLVTGWYAGSTLSTGEVLRSVLKRSPALLVAWLFIHLMEVAGVFILLFPALVVMTFYLVTAPAIAVEGLGPFAGMARAARLAGRRFWILLGVGVLSGLLASVLSAVLAVLPQLLGLLVGPRFGWILLGVGTILGEMVSKSVVAGITVLAYLDLRIRTEGLDLAFAADRHLPP